MKTFPNTMNCPVSYEDVRRAMKGQSFPMSLTDQEEIAAVIRIVNKGIDAHLEACYCPDRGDSFKRDVKMVMDIVLCNTLECNISEESLPVFLRRLSEDDTEGADSLLSSILNCLGFDDDGVYHPERRDD